jgi:hypothetical protein
VSHFDDETAVTALGGGRWKGVVSPDWSIGAVPNGGYVQAIALDAVARSLPHPHPLSVTTHFLRPCVDGAVDVEVEVVRAGRSVSTAMARLVQQGKERLRLLAAFGDLSTAGGLSILRRAPPTLAPPEDCVAPTGQTDPGPDAPSIATRVEVRIDPASAGWLDGHTDGITSYHAWTRLADGRAPDAMCLPLLVDAMIPAVFAAIPRQWVPTLELTTHVRGIPAGGWLAASVGTHFVIDGAFEEDCELWDSRGRLVALSRQLARILPA